MTSAVVEACRGLGWVCAARSTSPGPLRVRRGEYLAIDVLAFEEEEGWRWPVAAIELENSPRDDFVAYALWKACMVRADVSFLVCYRRQAEQIGPLVAALEREVLRPIAPPSEVVVVVGTRAAADTFPDGYFRQFYWDRTSEALRPGSRPQGKGRYR